MTCYFVKFITDIINENIKKISQELIEANQEKEQALKSKGNYIIALLGSEDNKQVNYYKCKNSQIATGNSIYEENTFHEFKIEKRKTQKLSSISNIQGSYDLIKIDVHYYIQK